jgi:hypothetical protein
MRPPRARTTRRGRSGRVIASAPGRRARGRSNSQAPAATTTSSSPAIHRVGACNAMPRVCFVAAGPAGAAKVAFAHRFRTKSHRRPPAWRYPVPGRGRTPPPPLAPATVEELFPMNRATSFATALLIATTLGACQNGLPAPAPAAPNNLGPPPAGGNGAAPPAAPAPMPTPPPAAPGPEGPGAPPPPPPVAARTLAFRMPPMDAIMKASFELVVEVRDGSGQPDPADASTPLTVKLASGGGQLTGTLMRTAAGGVATFDDLEYDRWESITLEVSAPGLAAIVTPPLPVRPLLRLKDPPPLQVRRMTPLGPFSVELADGAGAVVPAATGSDGDPGGGRQRRHHHRRRPAHLRRRPPPGPASPSWPPAR